MRPLLALLLLSSGAHAQIGDILKKMGQSTSAAGVESKPPDPLGRATPRGCVMGFLRESQLGHYELAGQYLQLSEAQRDSRKGAEIARELHSVLDFAYIGDLDRISDSAQGSPDARFPPDRETAGRLRTERGAGGSLVLARVEDRDYGRIWLISAETLALVPELYREIGFPEIEPKLPAALVEQRLFAVPLWRWLAAILAVPLCAGIAWLLIRIFLLAARGRGRWAETSTPLLLIVTMLLHFVAVSMLKIPLLLRQYYIRVVWISLTAGFAWLIWRWIGLGIERAYQRAVDRGAASTGSLIQLGRRILKIVIIAVAGFICLSLVGVHMTPALAGLGLSGLVLAFAAQKTLENVFGGVSLLTDETIRVGDFCTIGGQQGTVEDIGLRSTTLRTLDRTMLSVPNGMLATMTIENFAYRDKILFNPIVSLQYETTPEQMRNVLEGIRNMLREHSRVEKDSLRASLRRFGPSSMDIEIFSYVLTRDWVEFTAIREELLLRVMEIVQQAGTDFASTTQTLRISRDDPPENRS